MSTQWLRTLDANGDVCVNMDTGLRFRAGKDLATGMATGVLIIFPDGNTKIQVRESYDKLTDALGAINLK